MRVKKIVEIIKDNPALANNPEQLLALLNAKTAKKQRPVFKQIGITRLPTSQSDENGGEATIDDVEAAIAVFEKKDKKK